MPRRGDDADGAASRDGGAVPPRRALGARQRPLLLGRARAPHPPRALHSWTPRADPAAYKRRLKSGGNKKPQFTEGWVEFEHKRDAKHVAALLNNQPVGAQCGGEARRRGVRPCVPVGPLPP